MVNSSWKMSLVAAVTVALAACSGVPKPETEIALSNSALQNAEVAGAKKYAPIELRKAKEKQDLADAAVADEEYIAAKHLSEQAAADAEFAKAKSEAEKSRLALEEVQSSIKLIRTELNRSIEQ